MSEVEGSIPASSKLVRFSWSSIKIPEYSDERHSHPHSQRFNGVRLPLPAIFSQLGEARDTAFDFLGSLLHQQRNSTTMRRRMATPLLCCASISSAGNGENKGPLLEPDNLQTESKEREATNEFTNGGGDWEGPAFEEAEGSQQLQKHACGCRQMKEEEERVLISEVLFQNKDGEDLEDLELRNSAMGALKVCKPNSALTVQEVQEDCYRIFQSGYFWSISPVTVDTRDGVRLIFQVEPNQEFRGLICEGANVLPAKIVEDAFKDEYGKIVNIQRLIKVLNSINSWYRERGFLAEVSLGGVEMLSGGIIRLQASEAEVNNITIRFLDKKTGEPTVGKTRPETLLRQLTTKRGQVYSLQQVKRDIETLLTMGIMEDANIIPHPVGDAGKVDLTMNVVERTTRGFTAGGGISGSGMPGGLLSSLVGSFAYSHNNVFGRNQKLNVSLERGQIDSAFRINYTDPWIDGDDKRTSRSITLQNSRTPGTLVHGPKSPGASQSVTIGRLMAGLDYSRPLRPKWSGTAGLSFQRAGARDDNGNPVLRDDFQAPFTFTGKDHDDMLLSKLETVYADSGDRGSSMLVFNMEQGLPVYSEWLIFNRVNLRARHGMQIGHYRCIVSFSGGKVIGDLAPHEAFAIGGTNSVRGYEEGAVGSGRSFFVASGEISVPMYGPVAGAIFADYGTDFGSGQTVPGDPAGARSKPGSGYGYGAGIRVDTPLGPLRLEYAYNNLRTGRFHFGVGYRN